MDIGCLFFVKAVMRHMKLKRHTWLLMTTLNHWLATYHDLNVTWLLNFTLSHTYDIRNKKNVEMSQYTWDKLKDTMAKSPIIEKWNNLTRTFSKTLSSKSYKIKILDQRKMWKTSK